MTDKKCIPSSPSTTRLLRALRGCLALCAVLGCIAAGGLSLAHATKPKPAMHFAPKHVLPSPYAPHFVASGATWAKNATPLQKEPLNKEPVNKSAPSEVPVLDLNVASAMEFTQLPGIGPTKATRIVEWRQKNGRFRRVVDLRRVKGFGAKTVKKLAPYLRVESSTQKRKKAR